ncbi:MAG: hypothetical protein GC162_13190 [Planctomycetes bacterium]|nr:hypothetical protein [Planctomycetota bacterium]
MLTHTFITTLAQAQADKSATEAVVNIFSSFDALAHPKELVAALKQLPMVLAAIFICAGLVCMLQGFRLYKSVVIAIALITGLTVGYRLGETVKAEVILAGCLGVLLAVVAWPLMKYAVAVAGGIAGAFVGASAWVGIGTQLNNHGFHIDIGTPWVGALAGLLILGMLSFILFELSVVLFTSFSGSVLAVLGIIALMLQVDAWQSGIASGLVDKPMAIPLLVLVPAMVGLVLQHQWGAFKKMKKPTSPGAPAAAAKPA